MASHPVNEAAWLRAAQETPLHVAPAPYTPPGPGELVIRSRAIAVNPVDWALQTLGPALFAFVTYPCIVGCDVAGTVHAAGPGASRFAPGARVAAMSGSVMNQRPAEGAFQRFVVVPEALTFALPPALSWEDAAVLPVGFCTAAAALFPPTALALAHPTSPAAPPRGQVLLVWGAASAVGSNAVQLAAHAGYTVVATASARNFAYVRGLGAHTVLDYASPTIVADLTAACRDAPVAGAVNAVAAPDAVHALGAVLRATIPDGTRRFVACANPPPAPLPAGIDAAFVLCTALVEDVRLCAVLFEEFLGPALETGSYLAKPGPMVVGEGLAEVQGAMERQKEGVSAAKVVVRLPE